MNKKEKPGDYVGQRIMESAQEIWLAGLSAFRRADQDGENLFENLVEEGRKIESRFRQAADATFGEVKGRANSNWGNLEQVFEERVAQVLHQLGVPNRQELDIITQRIDDLERQIAALGGTATGSGSSIGKDNLKKISGIGEALERRLNEHGIIRYQQIAQWSAADVDGMAAILGARHAARIIADDWISQARSLHQTKYGKTP